MLTQYITLYSLNKIILLKVKKNIINKNIYQNKILKSSYKTWYYYLLNSFFANCYTL